MSDPGAHHPDLCGHDHFQGDGCERDPMEQWTTFERFLDRVEEELGQVSAQERQESMGSALRQGGWIELAEKVEAGMDATEGPVESPEAIPPAGATPSQREAWLLQADVLTTAAAIAQQWSMPELAEDLTHLAQRVWGLTRDPQ